MAQGHEESAMAAKFYDQKSILLKWRMTYSPKQPYGVAVIVDLSANTIIFFHYRNWFQFGFVSHRFGLFGVSWNIHLFYVSFSRCERSASTRVHFERVRFQIHIFKWIPKMSEPLHTAAHRISYVHWPHLFRCDSTKLMLFSFPNASSHRVLNTEHPIYMAYPSPVTRNEMNFVRCSTCALQTWQDVIGIAVTLIN